MVNRFPRRPLWKPIEPTETTRMELGLWLIPIDISKLSSKGKRVN